MHLYFWTRNVFSFFKDMSCRTINGCRGFLGLDGLDFTDFEGEPKTFIPLPFFVSSKRVACFFFLGFVLFLDDAECCDFLGDFGSVWRWNRLLRGWLSSSSSSSITTVSTSFLPAFFFSNGFPTFFKNKSIPDGFFLTGNDFSFFTFSFFAFLVLPFASVFIFLFFELPALDVFLDTFPSLPFFFISSKPTSSSSELSKIPFVSGSPLGKVLEVWCFSCPDASSTSCWAGTVESLKASFSSAGVIRAFKECRKTYKKIPNCIFKISTGVLIATNFSTNLQVCLDNKKTGTIPRLVAPSARLS